MNLAEENLLAHYDAVVHFRDDGHVYVDLRRPKDGLRVQCNGRGFERAMAEAEKMMRKMATENTCDAGGSDGG